MKARILYYTVLLQSEKEGGFTVTVPDLPGCVTFGSTVEEAQEKAKDAITGYLASIKKHKQKVPHHTHSLVTSVEVRV